jgi:hypothetical protein
VPKSQLFGNYEGKLVGTTRFELATSPTPILDLTQSEQLSGIYQCVRERERTRHNAYWTHIGPTNGPTLAFAITRHERQPAWLFFCLRLRQFVSRCRTLSLVMDKHKYWKRNTHGSNELRRDSPFQSETQGVCKSVCELGVTV